MAFYGCDSLRSLVVPASVTSIGEYAIIQGRYLTVYVYAGSVAEEYCIANNLRYELIKTSPSPYHGTGFSTGSVALIIGGGILIAAASSFVTAAVLKRKKGTEEE
jgi:hypothetical protein